MNEHNYAASQLKYIGNRKLWETTHGRTFGIKLNAIESQKLLNRREIPEVVEHLEERRQEGLNQIAKEIQMWLDFHAKDFAEEPDDESHVISMPVYPTRGVLKNWIKVLENKKITE